MGSGKVEVSGYHVEIGRGLLSRASGTIESVARAHRYAIITDDTVRGLYGEQLLASLGKSASIFSIPAGEDRKTRESWATITDDMLRSGFGRDSTVIALGGGVIGDLGGFIAATFMRGIPVVQMPTTLLAMIDASIGGKTGVDVPAGKNLVGAFHPPAIVIADLDVLRSLPIREWRAGLAEAIKHGVIADEKYLDWIEGSLTALAGNAGMTAAEVDQLVTRSVEIKAAVVREDLREGGLRHVLNFGHTIGHAIEAASEYTLLHGEAIAIGMVLECELAERAGVAATGTAERVRRVVARAKLPAAMPEMLDVEQVMSLMSSDKKARAGVTRFALPTRIGAMAGKAEGWTLAIDDKLTRDVLASHA